MRDFTTRAYAALLEAVAGRYRVGCVREALVRTNDPPTAILRHDVDRRPQRALHCARIAEQVGVRGTFYFRYPHTFDPVVLQEIECLGHEIGYHYEVLTKARGDVRTALRIFEEELAELRVVADITTACMHGAPLRPWNNLDIWQESTPADHRLLGEPYLDLAWDERLYLTDTGRGWNRGGVSVRDIAGGRERAAFGSTQELVNAIESGQLPPRIAITVHPERWVDSRLLWTWDLVWQSAKNVVKGFLIRRHR